MESHLAECAPLPGYEHELLLLRAAGHGTPGATRRRHESDRGARASDVGRAGARVRPSAQLELLVAAEREQLHERGLDAGHQRGKVGEHVADKARHCALSRLRPADRCLNCRHDRLFGDFNCLLRQMRDVQKHRLGQAWTRASIGPLRLPS